MVEALALLAEQVLGRDADVLEGELAGVGGVHPHLLQLARDREAGDRVALVAEVDDEQGDPVVARVSGRSCVTRTMKSARGPLVMKVLEPLITYSSPSRIAVVRMPATSEPAPGSVMPRQPIFSPLIRDQVALLLLLGAEQVDRGQDHVGLDREAHVEAARARVAHALGADQRVVVVAALAAVLLREAEAEEAELAGAVQHLVRPEGLLPLVAVGVELLLHPGLHRLAQVLVLLREDQVLALGRVVGLDHLALAVRGRGARHLRSPPGNCLVGSVARWASSTAFFQQYQVGVLLLRGDVSDGS